MPAFFGCPVFVKEEIFLSFTNNQKLFGSKAAGGQFFMLPPEFHCESGLNYAGSVSCELILTAVPWQLA